MADTQTAVDDGTRRQILEKVAHALESYYVFPEVARQMGERLRSGLAAGDYDSLAEPLALFERLPNDLQAICRDKHVRVRYSEDPRQFGLEESSPEERAEGLATARRENF